MIDPEIINEWIDRYNSGDLKEPELSRFRQLLDTDPELRVRVDIDRAVNKMLQNDDLFEFLEKVREVRNRPEPNRNPRFYILIAASLMMLISLGTIFMIFDKTGFVARSIGEVVDRQPSVRPLRLSFYLLRESKGHKKITPVLRREMMRNSMLAAAYRPLAEYELLVGAVCRSENFKLESPLARVGVPRSSVICFRWTGTTVWVPVTLEVLNNKGIAVVAQFPIQGNLYLFDTSCLGRGIFYWRIMSDDGLILMGSLTLF